MAVVSLKMPEELATRLAAAARRRGVSRSALVRDALDSYLRSGKTSRGSAAGLASDLIGALEGPADLSDGPRHMEEFGR